METEELRKIIEKHGLWICCGVGECADLHDADLSGTDLSNVNLYGVNLQGANLRGANLTGTYLTSANLRDARILDANIQCADLHGADLSGANLSRAELAESDLSGADLSGAYLRGANLRDANIRDANLTGADLSNVNLAGADFRGAILTDIEYDVHTSFFAMQCPEEGAFIGWKKCQDNVLVKLLIPEDAKRSSATSRKCRASKAIVLEVIGADEGISLRDARFVYEVGKEVVADSFDDDRWDECSNGIHFFVTRKEAENY